MDFFPVFQSLLHSDLPCAQRMIMAVLLNHADTGGRAWPSQERIATQAGLGERAVRDHLHALVTLGWLSITGHIGRNHIYRVSVPAGAASAARQEIPDDRQEMPQGLADDRQMPPCEPADSSTQPADSALPTGTFCRLTSHEPLINPPSTTHRETAGPSEEKRVKSLVNKSPPKHTKASIQTQPSNTHPKPMTSPQRDWREWNRRLAEEANAVAAAPDMPADFHTAWQGWQAYRTRRATEARISSEAVRWTRDAAEAGLRECTRAAGIHGWPAVIARIDQAISGGWQGINTDKISPAGTQRSAQTQHQRSDTTNPPGRYGGPPRASYAVTHAVQITSMPRHAPVPVHPPAPPPSVPASREEGTMATGSAYFMNQLNGRRSA